MENPYNEEQRKWLLDRQEHYRQVMNGVCMAKVGGDSPAEACEGEVGYRHAISERHLGLIADAKKEIRANKEIGSFAVWSEQYEDLERVPISRFSAGKWACQRHDARFPGIDAKQIDLSDPENLFKAVYRVVLRHNPSNAGTVDRALHGNRNGRRLETVQGISVRETGERQSGSRGRERMEKRSTRGDVEDARSRTAPWQRKSGTRLSTAHFCSSRNPRWRDGDAWR